MPDPEQVWMERIWSRTEYSELYEKRLKESFIHYQIDRDRDDECAEEWSPETMSLQIESEYDDPEYYERDRDIAHDLREAIEHSSVSSLESLDEWIFEMVERGEEGHIFQMELRLRWATFYYFFQKYFDK